MKHICDYGCGQEATHQFQNGKWCCSDNSARCPAVKTKNRESNIGQLRSEEARKKMSESQKGNTNGSGKRSEAVREKMRQVVNQPEILARVRTQALGYRHTEEAKTKMRKFQNQPEVKARKQERMRQIEWTEEKRKSHSKTLKGKTGGYHPGSSRHRCGRYKGIWCDSSWELAYVIYCLEHNIFFKRNWKQFPYIWEGEEHKYIPDFKRNGTYVEIKGYETERDKAKHEQFPHKLVVLRREEMKPILKYVTDRYGKDFIRLYE